MKGQCKFVAVTQYLNHKEKTKSFIGLRHEEKDGK